MKRLIEIILVILNIAAAGLLILSTTAGMKAPSENIIPSMLSYGYFLLLVINMIIVLLWLLAGKWYFLISTAAIVSRIGFVGLFFQIGNGTIEPQGSTVKVLSFNAHHYYGKNISVPSEQANLTDTNALQFLSLLQEHTPDVLCLQEYLPYTSNKKIMLADSMEAMGYRYHCSACPAMGHSATICWSRYPLINPVYIDSSSKLQIDMVKDYDTIRIFCLHLHSYKLDTVDLQEIDRISHGNVDRDMALGTAKKFKQTVLAHEQEWIVLKPLIETSPYPTLVAGDFNDTPASYIYQQMRQILQDCYTDRGKGFCTTYHGFFPDFRIDYVLHNERLKTLSYHRERCNISDHYPLIVELEIDPIR